MPECACGEDDCEFLDYGYPYCRSCAEHHRPPECAVNQAGQALARCGCPWDDVNTDADDRHRADCYTNDDGDYVPVR